MKIRTPFLLLFTLFFTACGSYDSSPCGESNGNVITQEIAVPLFHSVSNQTKAKVRITQSNNNEYSVKAVGSSNLLEALKCQVSGGKLILTAPACFANKHTFEIHIKMPRILALELTQAGKIIGENSWYTDAISIKNTSSGEVDIELDATHLTVLHDGSGKIMLYGYSPTMNIQHEGSGDIQAFGLYTKQVEIVTDGSGDAEVTASERLNAHIKSSGDVRYKGYPVLEVIDEGSGDIENYN